MTETESVAGMVGEDPNLAGRVGKSRPASHGSWVALGFSTHLQESVQGHLRPAHLETGLQQMKTLQINTQL